MSLRGKPIAAAQTSAMAVTTRTTVPWVTDHAPQTGYRPIITSVILTNVGAVDTLVTLHDGDAAAVLGTYPAPTRGAAGSVGGAVIQIPDGLRLTAGNTLYATNLTTGASVKVSAHGFDSAI